MPSAAHTFEIPVAPLDGLNDVVVYVTVVFPDAEVLINGICLIFSFKIYLDKIKCLFLRLRF